MYVNGQLMEGGMAERDHARQVFESHRLPPRRTRPCWSGSTAARSRCGCSRWKAAAGEADHPQLHAAAPSLYGRTEYRFPGGHNLPSVGEWSAQIVEERRGGRVEESTRTSFRPRQTGGDLVLDAAAKNVKPDRDIVLTRPKKTASRLRRALASRPSSTDGAEVSHAPLAAGTAGRASGGSTATGSSFSRRSADRDPLLARCQIEIVKTILENAEHDDTFADPDGRHARGAVQGEAAGGRRRERPQGRRSSWSRRTWSARSTWSSAFGRRRSRCAKAGKNP